MDRRHQQNGIALVTVVVVVAIISLLTFEIAIGQQVWLSHAQNLQDRTQAEWVRRGAREYAAMLMDRDRQDNNTDHLNEAWAANLPPFPAEGGLVKVAVEDQQGRFNLNNLVKNGQYNAEAGDIFRRLLHHANVDHNTIEPIVDWLDPDSQSRAGGAEDDFYMSQEPGYRNGNRAMSSVEELSLVKGISREDVVKLSGLVSALPVETKININTAPAEVLAALFQGMTIDEAKGIVDYRKNTPFETVADLKKAIPDSFTTLPKDTLISTGSEFFRVITFVEFGHYYQQTASLLHRGGQNKPTYYYQHERPLITIAKDVEGD